MTQFIESRLSFSFGQDWQVIKLDDHPDCREIFKKVPGIKDVDFLGIHNKQVFFIEVKNYSDHLPDNENKITSEELANQLVRKFCDALFIILAAHIRYKKPGWETFAKPISQGETIKWLAWVELDCEARNDVDEKRKKALWTILTNQLKTKLAALCSLDNGLFVGVTSSSCRPAALPNLKVCKHQGP